MADFRDTYAARLAELEKQKASIINVSGPLRQKYEDLWRQREAELAELHASIQSVEMPLPGIEAEAAALSQILSSRNVKMGV
jgi:hypothetical protein